MTAAADAKQSTEPLSRAVQTRMQVEPQGTTPRAAAARPGAGGSFPLGATIVSGGVNFSVFSRQVVTMPPRWLGGSEFQTCVPAGSESI